MNLNYINNTLQNHQFTEEVPLNTGTLQQHFVTLIQMFNCNIIY